MARVAVGLLTLFLCAGLALPAFVYSVFCGRETMCMYNLRSLGNFLEVYRREKGGFQKEMPFTQGKELWLFVHDSMDPQNFPNHILKCPVYGENPPTKFVSKSDIDYLGPRDQGSEPWERATPQSRPIACDDPQNHTPGELDTRRQRISVLLKSYAVDELTVADAEATLDLARYIVIEEARPWRPGGKHEVRTENFVSWFFSMIFLGLIAGLFFLMIRRKRCTRQDEWSNRWPAS